MDIFPSSYLHHRLLTMGLTPGKKVSIVRRLPFRGNLYVKIGNRKLALRFKEAEHIDVMTK